MHLFLACISSCKRWNYSRLSSPEAIWNTTYRTRLKFCRRKSNHLSPSERGWSNAWWNAAPSLQVKELTCPPAFQKSKKAPKCISRTKAPGELDIYKISVCSLRNKQCEKQASTLLQNPHCAQVSNNMNIKSPSIKSKARYIIYMYPRSFMHKP